MVHDRRDETEHLLNRQAHVPSSQQYLKSVGPFEEADQTVGDEMFGGLRAAADVHGDPRPQIVLVQRLAINVGVEQLVDQITSRTTPMLLHEPVGEVVCLGGEGFGVYSLFQVGAHSLRLDSAQDRHLVLAGDPEKVNITLSGRRVATSVTQSPPP
jgi:hypothetical protein